MTELAKDQTWAEVAAALGCDLRNLQIWRKRPDAPTGKDIPAWLAYRDANGLGESGPKMAYKELREAKLVEEVALLKIKKAKEERRMIDRDEVDELLHHIAANQRSRLYQYLETELPPKCEGLTAAQLRPIFRAAADDVCDQMAALVARWTKDNPRVQPV